MSFDGLIDTATLQAHLQDPQWVVFDCRFNLADTEYGRRAYAEAHIPGARYAHMDEDLSSPITPESGRHPLPDTEGLCEWLGRMGVDDQSHVVVYDDCGGAMAVRLWWLLRWLGHEQVAVLDGGWPAWLAAGLAVDDVPPQPRPREFRGVVRPEMVVDTDELLADCRAGTLRWTIIDGRTAERYRGESEPIDPVAGHIPGALNLPFPLHLAEDGRFRTATELRALYTPLLGEPLPTQVACYCGSGVTACHNILALKLAGYPDAILYAGSWSEWIRDPLRPIAEQDPGK